MAPDAPAFGVYVHIPFCTKRCDYCAFATWTDRMHIIDEYLDACVTDLDRARDQGLPAATSVFVGGGTPSLVRPDALMRVLDHVPRVDGAEITIECNPDTVTPELLRTYRESGVNRLSFGVQSMVAHVLHALGRTHDRANVITAVRAARDAGFESFNLDLIYGAVGEGLDDWRATLDAVLALEPSHVSAYGLTVEPGTPLADQPERHPDDDDQADKYVIADRMLAAGGLQSYEISNWAKPGFECQHNLLYWSQGEYLGVGCAAHSHRAGSRWWNVRTPERYIAAIARGVSPIAASEHLDDTERRIEALQLALRTRGGVPRSALPDDLGDLVERRGERVVLTVRGRLLANEVALRLS